jgi:cathepsin L
LSLGLGQCTGATAELAFNYVADITATKQGGMFKIADLPYNVSKLSCDLESSGNASAEVGIDGWTKLPGNDYKSVMNALAKIGPVAIAVSAGCWGSYEKGVFDGQQCKQSTIDHAVLMVGYGVDEVTGEKYYKIRNSWGTTFGENGESMFLLRSQLFSFHRIVLIYVL